MITGLVVQTRFAQIAQLALPAWVDSLHHALLIRVATEHGRAPLALAPYLPVAQLPYHSGYHSVMAAIVSVANQPMPQSIPHAMLWYGQFMGALAALACAGAAEELWRHSIAGVVALVVAGLVSVMPAYYVSWGRYTLLMGMLMLPAALLLLRDVARQRSPRALVAAALVLAGLSLVHFVISVFALVWCIALLFEPRPNGRRSIRARVGRLTLVGMLAGLVQFPWIALLAAQAQPGTGVSAMHVIGNSAYNAMPYGLLWTSTNPLLAALGAVGALLALARHRRVAAQIAIWSLLVILMTNLPLLGLPYISFLTNEIVAVTMFLPLALLIGGGAALLAERAGMHAYGVAQQRRQWLAALLLVVVAGWRATEFQSVIRPDTVLASPDDVAAINWVASSTPPDASFVVNTAGWLADVDRGADGGWWLLPLAGRRVSTPPVVYTYGSAAYVASVKRDTAWLRNAGLVDVAKLATFMRSQGYTYAYATTSGQTLTPERLRVSPLFKEVYANSSVAIFELRP
jgi:hypothetical protein